MRLFESVCVCSRRLQRLKKMSKEFVWKSAEAYVNFFVCSVTIVQRVPLFDTSYASYSELCHYVR